MTFRCFMSPDELLRELIRRFTADSGRTSDTTSKRKTQLRVSVILKDWLALHADFEADSELSKKVQEFIANEVAPQYQTTAATLQSLLTATRVRRRKINK